MHDLKYLQIFTIIEEKRKYQI